MIPALLALLACAPAPSTTTTPPAAAAVSLEATVASARVDAGAAVDLTVTLTAPTGWEVAVQPPVAEGLTITPTAAVEAPMTLDGREQRVFHYALSGPEGSYIIQPGALQATAPGSTAPPSPIVAPPIFVDVGVVGPSGGELAAFEEPPPPLPGETSAAWVWWVVGGILLGAGATALGLWWMREETPEGEGLSPAARARQQWRAACRELADEQARAVALSAIFRRYLQEQYGFPAEAATSREVLAALSAKGAVPPVAHARLTEVLEASDRLKYAGEGGGDAFFAELEVSFEAVLALASPDAAEVGRHG